MSSYERKPISKTCLVSPDVFFIIYGVMFLNVDDTSHIYLSLNRLYMSLLMVAPMALIMLLVMRSMYPNKGQNGGIVASSLIVLIMPW
ncbi:hypothetical protein [Mucilaginibacter pedocola]|uniref:hypothetical protein n=1 Tax=Mucilaginibacter pedocola TaxID=1792845 RepID=UPI00192E5E0E|nr:hypothetical protein [Mucilaginibacter pedocola]